LFIAVVVVTGCKEKISIYRIGALLPTTGEAEGYGQQVKHGLTLALDEINGAGGIQGKKIDIFFEDDESSEQKAVQKATNMINASRVPLIIGGVTSNIALAVAPICQQKQVVLLSPSASSPKLSGVSPYFFRNYPSDTIEGHVMADHAIRRMGIKSVAVLFLDKEYGQGLDSVFTERFTGLGGSIKYEQGYPEGTSDFSAFVKEIKTAAPDAVYLPGYYTDIALILRELKKQEVTAKVISSGGMASPRILEMAAEEAEGVVFPQAPFDVKSGNPVVQKFVSNYKSKFFTEPDVYAAYAYDSLKLVAGAIERCGDKFPQDLRARLADTTGYHGITGEVAFDAKGDVDTTPHILQVKGGAFVPLQ
jgi:branched-chain amino acid transport system substrate-binding protein